MDLKKEIKLSDLLPKRRKRDTAEAPKPERKSRFARKPKDDTAPKHKAPKVATPKRERGPRTKKLVGLKIGASQIAAARVVNNGAPELVQVAREELDGDLVVGGELRKPEELAQVLRSFFRKHKLPRQGVRLGISNNRVGVRIFEIAGIHDEKQLANAIKYRAQETLPIPVEEAALDYQILGERVDEEGVLHRRVLLVVAYRDLIDHTSRPARRPGSGSSASTSRRCASPCSRSAADSRARELGDRRRQRRPRPHDFRSLRWTGLPVHACSNGAAARSTPDREGARPLTLEAQPIKLALSLSEPSIPAGLTSEQAEQVREAVLRDVHEFARELVSSLQFYQSQPGSLGIGEIVLTGGTAQLPGFAAELSRLLGVRTRSRRSARTSRSARRWTASSNSAR